MVNSALSSAASIEQLSNKHSHMLRLICLRQLIQMLGISRSAVYEKFNPKSPRYDVTFPRPIKLGKSSIRFELQAVERWLQLRIEQSQLPRN